MTQLAFSTASLAVSKIIIVPTARTVGVGRYEVTLDHKAGLLDASERQFDVDTKVGLGERVQLEAQVPFPTNNAALYFAKYTFALANDDQTAAALGIEHAGSGNRAAPYLALTHLFKPVDLTVGIASGADAVMTYYVGVDCMVNDKLRILSDYNTGSGDFLSAGIQYRFSEQWKVKTGIVTPREGLSNVVVKITYSGSYD